MAFIITSFERLLYIYEHIFWLKELLTLLKSTLFFLLVVWSLRRKRKIETLFILSACLGMACVYFGDNEYWSENDILNLSLRLHYIFALRQRSMREIASCLHFLAL